MREKIIQLRLEIDALSQVMEIWFDAELENIGVYSHLYGAKQSLLFAKAWLGKALGSLGQPSPYSKDGSRKTVADIEPTAERASKSHRALDGTEPDVESIDKARVVIAEYIDRGLEIYEININPATDIPTVVGMNVHTHLCEARFHLGFVLEAMREAEDG